MKRDSKNRKKEAVSSLIPGIIKDRGWQRQMELHSIFPKWRDVVDGDAAARTVPLKIVKGVLWLEVENSAWLQQFQFQKIMLLEAVNAFLPNTRIKDIRFVLPSGDDRSKEGNERVRFVAPSPDEVQAFEKQVAFIEDDKVRESLLRFWYLAKACVRENGDEGERESEK